MENNNPKKSKALIITFILVLILLIVGYYIFKNRTQIFDAKGSTTFSKIFSPLLGTSKDKTLKVIDENNGKTDQTTTIPKKTGVVITDTNGNKFVLAEAGEILKKGDVLYIAGFNKDNLPIVMKAIANDKNKSLVFGVAGEDMDKGKLGNIIIEGILSGVPTNRKEGTLWATNNPLYLSDKVYGGMVKNPPVAPSLVVPVGSVIKVDPINGSIRIGGLTNKKMRDDLSNLNLQLLNNPNMQLMNALMSDLRDYWNSIFNIPDINVDITIPDIKQINIPDIDLKDLPIVDLVANPEVVQKGGTSTITWTSERTASCAISGGGINATGTSNTTGIKTGKLNIATSITATCRGTDGSATSDTVIVRVDGDDNTDNLPSVNIVANPTTVNYTETSTITWSSINTTSCAVSGGGVNATGTSNTTGVKTNSLRRPISEITVVCKGTNGSTVGNNVFIKTVKSLLPCDNGADNPPACNTINGECLDKTMTNYPACDTKIDTCTDKTMTNFPACDTKITVPDKCLAIVQNPLTFTPEEKARLAVLLRKFYLVSSTLKTSDDITTIYNEIDQQKNFINQIQDLTKQCYLQTNDGVDFNNFCGRNKNLCDSNPSVEFTVKSTSGYKSAETNLTSSTVKRHGNPWFTKTSGGTFPYTNENTGYVDYNWIQGTDGPGCKVVSGYYSGTLEKDTTITSDNIVGKIQDTTWGKVENFLSFGLLNTVVDALLPTSTTTQIGKAGQQCSDFNNFSGYNSCTVGSVALKIYNMNGQPNDALLKAGCKWQDGVNFSDTERILNIW